MAAASLGGGGLHLRQGRGDFLQIRHDGNVVILEPSHVSSFVDDGDGASGSDTATINITAVNDGPDLTPNSPLAVSYTENAAPTQLLATGAVADPDAPANFATGGLDLQITAGSVAGDAIVLLASSGFTISAGALKQGVNTIGTISGNDTGHVQVTNLTAFATPSVVNALAEAFGFHSTSEDPGSADRTVTITFPVSSTALKVATVLFFNGVFTTTPLDGTTGATTGNSTDAAATTGETGSEIPLGRTNRSTKAPIRGFLIV